MTLRSPDNQPKPIPDDWELTDELRIKMQAKYTTVDVVEQADLFLEYWINNDTAKAKKKRWDLAFNTWCHRARMFQQERKATTGEPDIWKR
jgi:hypothetical protein